MQCHKIFANPSYILSYSNLSSLMGAYLEYIDPFTKKQLPSPFLRLKYNCFCPSLAFRVNTFLCAKKLMYKWKEDRACNGEYSADRNSSLAYAPVQFCAQDHF